MTPSSRDADGRAATLADERAIMDGYAPVFREWTVTNGLVYRRERAGFVRWILRCLAEEGVEPTRLRYLDVGCSTGELIEVFRELGCHRVVGLDLSPAMLREARRHVPGLAAAVGFVEAPPLAAASFDVVVTSFTIHHLADPRAFFDLSRRVLAPGGCIFALEYNADGWALRRGGSRDAIRLLSAPLRGAAAWKNRAVLARGPRSAEVFNRSHRLLGVGELRALAAECGFRSAAVTRGIFGPWVLNELVAEKAVDRALLSALAALEHLPRPFSAGAFQRVRARRDDP